MKQKLEKVLSKLYMPGQDQIIGGMSSNGLPHNVIRGAQQTLEMNHGVNMDGVEGEEEQSNHNHGASQELRAREQEWANELRRADERSHEVRQRCEDLKKANSELEARCKAQEQQIETRDVEILRLGGLYQGGQNNDKLSMQYSQEQNQKIVGKLNAQLDFLNKENHRLQTQLDLFVKDKSVVEHIDKYRADIDDLTFENQTLRKDLRELTVTLKDYQEADFHRQREARALADQQQASEREIDKQRQDAQ
jgi:chromosome segregation ATPase